MVLTSAGAAGVNDALAPTHVDGLGSVERHPGDVHAIPASKSHSSFAVLKDRIKQHYDLASEYYYSLWGEHIHHSYFKSPEDTKETGQVNLIELLLEIAQLRSGCQVLDVGCGVGGTSRYLAKERDCYVTGITISARQVVMAKGLSTAEKVSRSEASSPSSPFAPIALSYGGGSVTFQELDAELLGAHFHPDSFDAVWITEALSHFPNKPLFFENAHRVLRQGGKLVLADWFKDTDLSEEQMKADIHPIEDGMLLPPLCTMQEYVRMAEDAGLRLRKNGVGDDGFKDISHNVAKTWDISWSLIQSPSLWAFAVAQGRDGLAFLQSFRAMRRGYASGTFRYAVMSFEK